LLLRVFWLSLAKDCVAFGPALLPGAPHGNASLPQQP